MANKKLCVAAQLSGTTRSLLLRLFPPEHANVFCRHIMWQYDVGSDFEDYPQDRVAVTVFGRRTTATTDSLLVSIGGRFTQPCGKEFHITLSTTPGTAPAAAGDETGEWTKLDNVSLLASFVKRRASVVTPEAVRAYA